MPGYSLFYNKGTSNNFLAPAQLYLGLDINECENSMNFCNGTCENTPGSYNCFCPTGYVPNPRGDLCIGKFNFSGIQIIKILIIFQILMNAAWEYMIVVEMLFVLTPLEGSIVLARITSLEMEDPVLVWNHDNFTDLDLFSIIVDIH